MAKIARLPLAPEFVQLKEAAIAAGDDNDCFVKAIAVLTDLDYNKVREAFAEAGRKSGKGTPWSVAREAVKALGYDMVKAPARFHMDMIAQYPGVHKNLKNLTTRHPVRFAKAWEGQSVLLHTNGHVAAVKDGKMVDWSVNRSFHVIDVYTVVKL